MVGLTLKGDVTVKMLDLWQAEPMYEFLMKNKDFFVDWIPFASRITSVHDMQAFITQRLEKYSRGGGLYYTLWHQGAMIGYVLVRELDQEARWAEIGYMIDSGYQGRGIVKECCLRLIDHLFDDLGMEKIVICCSEDNEKSRVVAQRLGFTLEGALRNHYVVNGRLRTMLFFGLLKEEALRSTS